MHRTTTEGTTMKLSALAVALVAAAVALVGADAAAAEPAPVQSPQIAGVAPLPGPLVPSFKTSSSATILTTKPDIGVTGSTATISGVGLPASKQVTLAWSSANVSWILDARPDSVDYTGRKVDKIFTTLAQTQTDAAGALTATFKIPRDYGGIHDIYAVVDGVAIARGSFLVGRTLTISPTRGPIGTPITIRVTGLGSPLYDSGGAIYWDNHYTGVFTGNTTRGEVTFQIRAAGAPGPHQIVSGPAITIDYLNPLQSPQPWQPIFNKTFTITKGSAIPASRVDWPAEAAATVAPSTAGSALSTAAGGATAKLSTTSGYVLSKVGVTASGLVPGQPVDIHWGTVVGNRVNCTGQCWSLTSFSIGNATATAAGTLDTQITIPDNLGGWHLVRLVQNGQAKAEVSYFVTRQVVQVPKVVKAGQTFTVHLKGVGWTQLDNTVAVTYDNSYVGYGCGFNSNGDVLLNLVATGGPGTHLIDLYPLLYTQNPVYSGAAGVYGMVPFLSYAQDAPGLSLGYKLPALRVAITVVK
jgi:hypothetical protein